MIEAVRSIYARVPYFVRALPLIVAIPFAAELLQHVAEIRLGMYATGELGADGQATRLAFGIVKILCILIALIYALRWWAAERGGSPGPAGWGLAKGIATVLAVQTCGEGALVASSLMVANALHAGAPVKGTVAALAILLWQFLSTLLIPWFVALLVGDAAMTLRRSVAAVRGRMWSMFALLLAGYLPLMLVHYALGYGAIGRPEGVLWAMMVVDAGVVALLAILIASTYFTIYRLATDGAADLSGAPLAA